MWSSALFLFFLIGFKCQSLLIFEFVNLHIYVYVILIHNLVQRSKLPSQIVWSDFTDTATVKPRCSPTTPTFAHYSLSKIILRNL